MPAVNNPLSLRAYERKSELGGGFRGVVVRHADKARFESDVLETYEAARDWAIREADRLMGSTPYRRASVNAGTAGRSYRANIWSY